MARSSDIVRYLQSNAIPFELIAHEPAYTACDVASVVHVPDSQLAKTLVVCVDRKYWMVVLRADQRLNERLLKRLLAATSVRLAHEEDLEALFPGCDLGAMPPFGNLYGLPVIVDQALTEDDDIVFNACKHTESMRMKYRDYERLVRPLIGRFAIHRGVPEDRGIP